MAARCGAAYPGPSTIDHHYYWLEVEHPGGTWRSRWLNGRQDIKNIVLLLRFIQRLKS
ncbi:hypothetical protein ACL02U_17655 [Streptomyces sp. MS06]|uniref:hypothetical protein n=1 Tax=Streptomyces sp. MS06 TaxID=3385974 RepID=UPI0039A396FE